MKITSASSAGRQLLPLTNASSFQTKLKRKVHALIGIGALLGGLMPVAVRAQLPSGWSGTAIGTGSGSETYNAGTQTFTLAGTGSRVWATGPYGDSAYYTFT